MYIRTTRTWSTQKLVVDLKEWCFGNSLSKKFGTNVQHIAGVDNIVADTLSRLPSTTVNRYETSTTRGLLVEKTIYL